MAGKDVKPDVQWDELCVSTSSRDLLRYRKDGRERAYKLRVLGEHAELWVISGRGGNERKSRKMATFTNPDDVRPFLQSVEQDLRSGGWMETNASMIRLLQ